MKDVRTHLYVHMNRQQTFESLLIHLTRLQVIFALYKVLGENRGSYIYKKHMGLSAIDDE